jgi:hypothetical protein
MSSTGGLQVAASITAAYRRVLESLDRDYIDDPNSPKLYLLRGMLEPEKNSPPAQKTLCSRHYSMW